MNTDPKTLKNPKPNKPKGPYGLLMYNLAQSQPPPMSSRQIARRRATQAAIDEQCRSVSNSAACAARLSSARPSAARAAAAQPACELALPPVESMRLVNLTPAQQEELERSRACPFSRTARERANRNTSSKSGGKRKYRKKTKKHKKSKKHRKTRKH